MTYRNATSRRLLAGVSALMLLAACESKEEKAIKFAASGQEYMAQGDLESAELQFNNALYQDPINIDALRGAAEIAAEQDEPVRQGRMLRRLLNELPDDVEANLAFARLALLGGDGDMALDHAERVLAQQPDNSEALTIKGATLVVENRLDEATEILNRALEQDPDNAEIFNLLAAGDIRADDFDAALARINEGIEQAENPETLLIVKLILAERVEGEQAVIQTFEDLIEVAPENGLYRQRLADYVLLKRRDFDRARQLYMEALPLVTDQVPVYTRIVAIDRQAQGDEAAEQTLLRFIEQNPGDTDLLFTLPLFYCQTGQPERCVQAFERLANDESLDEADRLRARVGLSDAAMSRGDMQRGEALADEILAEDPQNAAALTNKAQALLTREETEEAIPLLRDALSVAPDNAEAMLLLALAYEQSGQIQYADQQFAQTISEAGYTKPVSDQYRAFLTRQGETQRARQVLERYVSANPSDLDAVLDLAQSNISRGDTAAALESLERLQETNASPERVERLRLAALAQSGDIEGALDISRELVAASPDDRRLLVAHTRLLAQAGQTEEAVTILRERVGEEDATAGDYVILAETLIRSDDRAGAVEVAEAGIERFPGAESLYLAAYAAQRPTDQAAAEAYLTQATENAERPVRSLEFLSNTLIVAGQHEEAITVLRRLQALDALAPATANNLASLLLERPGSEAEALSIAEQFRGTENAYFADTLAWAYYKNGQVEQAVPLSVTAAEGAPENADILYHRGVIAAAAGDAEAAQQALQAARRLKDEEARAGDVSMDEIDAALAQL